MKTKVIFRKYTIDKLGGLQVKGRILALFPYNPSGHPNECECIELNEGCTGTADYNLCLTITKPATEKEYKELYKYLKKKSYNLQVIKKRSFGR